MGRTNADLKLMLLGILFMVAAVALKDHPLRLIALLLGLFYGILGFFHQAKEDK